MTIRTVLRVLAGVAVIGLGVWLFARQLPTLDLRRLTILVMVGVIIIEAPRVSKTLRDREQRMVDYIEHNASAVELIDRSERFNRWAMFCFVAGAGLVVVGIMLGTETYLPLFVGAGLLIAAGAGLRLYDVYARTAVDFRSASAANPKISQSRLWLTTAGMFAIVLIVTVASRIGPLDLENIFWGVVLVIFVSAVIWGWLRGCPADRT